ncbi:transposase [Streptomyces sp. CA-111067]|uniref:transposase n=1 Tax=Streptomyces sp. CA-111067 TaxID=3240046 RepID=UPI003D99E13B
MEPSNRQAAESGRNRIDFKYALGMVLEDSGFHHGVLTDFRNRLAEEGRADRLLDLALEKIRAVGMVRERGRQRTGSTHVLPAVRDLTRLELVTEAMPRPVPGPPSTAPVQDPRQRQAPTGVVTRRMSRRPSRLPAGPHCPG